MSKIIFFFPNYFLFIFLLLLNIITVFSGDIEVDNIREYKYVALNNKNEVVNEEIVNRIYSENNNYNEVYNR